MLIVIILSVGIFGAFGVGVSVVRAQQSDDATSVDYVDSEKQEGQIDDFFSTGDSIFKKNDSNPNSVFTNTYVDPTTKIVNDAARFEVGNRQRNSEFRGVTSENVGSPDRDAEGDAFLSVDKKVDKSITGCSANLFKLDITQCIRTVVASLGEIVLEFFGFIVGVSGKLLNLATEKTVLQMGSSVKKIGAVEEGWRIFRDLANIMIIFVLLIIGIATILQSQGYGAKKLLGMLIAVAILINFSLFFTNIVIDSSNLLALQFYNKVEKSEIARGGWTNGWSGFGDSYMQAFKLSTLYNSGGNDFSDLLAGGGSSTGRIFLITILGSILFLVAAFSFLAGVFLLMSRYVVLIFLMILAPVAFVGMILPATSGYAKQWMSMLFKYAFFAPIYFLLTWFVIKVINSDAFAQSLGLFGGERFSSVVNGGSVELILNFVIVIFFIIGSLIIANNMGIKGSKAVMSWGGAATKWGRGFAGGATFGAGGRILRNTAGRGASKLADSEKLKTRAAGGGAGGVLARMQLRGLRGVAGSSFDVRATKAGKGLGLGKAGGKGGYQGQLKQQIKAREEFAGSLFESKKTPEERIEEQKIREQIKLADTDLLVAKENLEEAEMDYSPGSREVIAAQANYAIAQDNKKTKDNDLKLMQEKLAKRGVNRQRQYADTLESEKTLGTMFTKVPRKNKEGSDAVRKLIKNAKNKKLLDVLRKEMESGDKDTNKEKDEEIDNLTDGGEVINTNIKQVPKVSKAEDETGFVTEEMREKGLGIWNVNKTNDGQFEMVVPRSFDPKIGVTRIQKVKAKTELDLRRKVKEMKHLEKYRNNQESIGGATKQAPGIPRAEELPGHIESRRRAEKERTRKYAELMKRLDGKGEEMKKHAELMKRAADKHAELMHRVEDKKMNEHIKLMNRAAEEKRQEK